MKVHAYLLYKQIPFRVHYANPMTPEKDLPLGRAIPVLTIGDDAKADSHQIGLWLDQQFDQSPLYSQDDDVIAADLNLNQTLIPMTFYSIYPQYDGALGRSVKNTLRLGRCVDQTTAGGLPWAIRYLWPLFIRNAGFIKTLIKDAKSLHSTALACRQATLRNLDDQLKDNDFIVDTKHPSMADISAWPLLVVPYQLRLNGFDDFMAYPNIMRWINDIKPMLINTEQSPWFVPEDLDPLPI